MGRLTLCVDFDGVLYNGGFGEGRITGEPLDGAIEWLRALLEDDRFEVFIFTTRAAEVSDRRTQRVEIARWLVAHGIPEERIPEVIGTKVAAHLYIDDRGFRFEGPGTYPSPDALATKWPWWDHLFPRIGGAT